MKREKVSHRFLVERNPCSATCKRCGLVAWVRLTEGVFRLGTEIYVLDAKGRKVQPSKVRCEPEGDR